MTDEWAGRRLISADEAPLVLLGLQVAGYPPANPSALSGQSVDAVARQCAPDDAQTQATLHIYLAFLLAVVEHPAFWGLVPAQVPDQIARHGEAWYRTATDAAQRQGQARVDAERMEREMGAPLAVQQVEGHLRPQAEEQEQNWAALRLEQNLAAEIADRLVGVGYHLALDQIEGRTISEVAQACEPDDLVKRRLVLLFLTNFLRVRHRDDL